MERNDVVTLQFEHLAVNNYMCAFVREKYQVVQLRIFFLSM